MKKLLCLFLAVSLLGFIGAFDARVQCGPYMRAWHMAWTSQGQTGYYGDATYYEFPGPDEALGTSDDKNLLIDGGGQATAGATVANLLDDRLPAFNNTLYFMALSSPGADHYNGLKMAVSRFTVLNYYENVRWPAGYKAGYDSLIADIDAEGANVYYYDAGDWLSGPDTTVGPSWGSWSGWDPNITARVLVANSNPSYGGADDNEWAGMLLIKCGETGFLTGGDQTILQQETWIEDPENTDHSYDGAWNDLTHADFYKVGHHGSTGASSPTFVNRMAPAYAIVEVAFASGDHPTMEALDACYDAGAIQYRTDLDYVVQVMADDSDNYEINRWQAWSTDTEGNPYYYASSPDINSAPPDLVTGLTVDEVDTTKVVLTWSPGGYDYNVYRSQYSGGDASAGTATQPGVAFATGIYEKLTASPIGYTTYTDTSWPVKDTNYYYVIASIASTNTGAYYTKQERRWSNEVSAFVPNKSPTPVGYKTPTPTPTPSPDGGGGRKWTTPLTMPTEPPPTTPITAAPGPGPTAVPIEKLLLADLGDYDGDGIADVAIFRPASGLWSIRGITRLYFGISPAGVRPPAPSTSASGSDPYTGDLPASGDYDGDGTADIATFRPTSGRWAIRLVSRIYYGGAGDSPVPGDYDGDGICDIAIFRTATGLWAVQGLTKLYFGTQSDQAVPGNYDGDGAIDIGIFRSSTGLWKIKDLTLFYLGTEGDIAVPGDYDGSGLWTAGIFRPASGLWAIRGITRLYFGEEGDQLVPGDYDGDLADDIAIFRESTGLWAVEGVTRLYLGP